MKVFYLGVITAVVTACHTSSGRASSEAIVPLTAVCPLDGHPVRAGVRSASVGQLGIEGIDVGSGAVLTDHQVAVTLQTATGERQLRTGRLPVRFDALPPGAYIVRTNAIGYKIRIDSLRLPDSAGLVLRLPVSPAPFDACGGLGTVVSPDLVSRESSNITTIASPAAAVFLLRSGSRCFSGSPLLVGRSRLG